MIRALAASIVAFVVGMQVAGGKTDYSDAAKELLERQKKLFGDIERIEQARIDLLEVMATRKDGKFVLNREEIKLEKSSRSHLHIFMERFRNDTLETLALYDRLVTNKKRSVLEVAYGKRLNEIVEVAWRERALDEIADELIGAYGVKLFIKGNVEINRTMSLVGEMSLVAIFEHIQNTFRVKIVNDDGELWFTHDKSKPATDDILED
ncbi:MAG: hypothetical protein O7E54_02910 [Planctomycetota bacterium]|nr:hypothetical protein [Planctomycetota bacterium]